MNRFLLALILAVACLAPAFSSPVDLQLSDSDISLEVNETEEISLRVVHTNETTNLSVPIEIYADSPLDFSFSEDCFTLLTAQNIYVNVTVSSRWIKAGKYPSKIIVMAGDDLYNLPLNITVLESEIFNVTLEEISSLEQGEMGAIYANISNNGNTDITLEIGLQEIFTSAEEVTIPVGAKIPLPIFYSLPDDYDSGEKTFEFSFGDYEIERNVTIIDRILPEIVSDYPDEVYVAAAFLINATCTDNENVTSFYYLLDGEKYNFTHYVEFSSSGTQKISLVCEDDYENVRTENISIEVRLVPVENLSREISIPTMEPGKDIERFLFRVPSETSATVRLYNSTDGLEVVLEGKKSYRLDFNETADVLFLGNASIVLSGLDEEGNYSGRLEIEFGNESQKGNEIIYFHGYIGDYSVPESVSVDINGKESTCEGYDGGDYASSYVICSTKYPVDVDLDTITVPISKAMLELMEENYNSSITQLTDDYESEISKYQYLTAIILMVAVIVGLVIIYRKSYPSVGSKIG